MSSLEKINLEFENYSLIYTEEKYNDKEKSSLIKLINILTTDEFRDNFNVNYIGEILILISIDYNDTKLLSWLFKNKYGKVDCLLGNSHVTFANEWGFNINKIKNKN